MAMDRHITIQLVDYVLPPRALGWLKLFVHVVVGATCLAMAYSIYDLIATDIGQRTPAAEIPLVWIYLVPLVGLRPDGPARRRRDRRGRHPAGPGPRRAGRVSLALLLLG